MAVTRWQIKHGLPVILKMNVYPAESVLLSAAYALISDNDNTDYAFDNYTMQKKNTGLLHYITCKL